MTFLHAAAARWNVFWFSPEPASRLAVFRCVHCLTILLFVAAWWLDAAEWLTADGFHFANEVLPPLPREILPYFAIVQFGALLLLAAGWKPRLTATVSLFLFAYVTLVDRAAAHAINSIYMFSLTVLAVYGGKPDSHGNIPAAPIRLLQLALVTIYFSSGWHKAVSGDWLDSPTILRTSMQGIYMTDAAAWAVVTLPLAFWAVSQYLVLAFELFSPVLFCSPKLRIYAVAAGCCFHLGIALFMDKLIYFSLQMMSFYVLFLPVDRWMRHRKESSAGGKHIQGKKSSMR